jgi:hypothetical protein
VKGSFEIGSPETTCLGWLRTTVLLISPFSVAGITYVSHWHLDDIIFFMLRQISFGIYRIGHLCSA